MRWRLSFRGYLTCVTYLLKGKNERPYGPLVQFYLTKEVVVCSQKINLSVFSFPFSVSPFSFLLSSLLFIEQVFAAEVLKVFHVVYPAGANLSSATALDNHRADIIYADK